MRGSTLRRSAVAAILAAAVGAATAGAADAATVTRTDDSTADFTAGTLSNTVVRADGVELARTLEESFAGDALPGGWTATQWETGGTGTVTGGSLVVDGARADSGVTAGPGSSLEFRGTLGAQPFSHVGFAVDFNDPPWAMFSTGSDGGGKLYARVATAMPGTNVEIQGVDANVPHDYRITWTATGFEFFVDGASVATIPVAITAPLRPAVSNYALGGGEVTVESMTLYTRTDGTFVSRVHDAGDARVTGLVLTPTAIAPTGTTIAYRVRTAATEAGLASAPWTALDAAEPNRFMQYEATFNTTNAAVTPRLDKVDVTFTVDDEPPAVSIQDVAVAGTTARVSFAISGATGGAQCSLDGATFASCTSPAEFGNLAPGSHTIVVRAVDAFGNAGSATRTFTVSAPPAGGGGGNQPPSGGGGPVDTKAPRVLVSGRTLKVSRRGVAKLRIRCPRTEVSCSITATLRSGGRRIARRTLTVEGGVTRTFRLQLSRAARRSLAARGKLRVKAVIFAVDAAGNDRTTTRRVTLRAPAA